MRKIILLIDCSSEYDRRLLRGLVRYSKEHSPWAFYRFPVSEMGKLDGGERIVSWAKAWKADAIVGRWRWDDISLLEGLDIPVVLQNYTARSPRFSNLTGDYIGTGEKVARFFLEHGFKRFAYFGAKNVIWSEERLQGFEKVVERSGGTLDRLLVRDPFQDREKTAEWLRGLPKPVAMFACDDAYALNITEMCGMEGISIPEDISLVGVDNDDLLCQIASPQISSVELNVEQGGYHLGEMLDRQFESGSVWSFNVVVTPGDIVERMSTKRHRIADPHVEKLVNYIDDNYSQYITTEQLFERIPLSRRNLEIRFKREMSTTVYKYLTDCRMRKFTELLLSTKLSIAEISEKCGLQDSQNVSRMFQRLYGCAPSEYRMRHKN